MKKKTAKKTAETPAEPAAAPDAPETGNAWPEETPAAVDEVGRLKSELAEAKEKILYLQADYQNYRKRMTKELTDARLLGTELALEPFLKVNDFLLMARDSAEKSDNLEAIRQGVAMIIAEYGKAFDDLNVKRLDAVGKPFDPNTQEAVANEPSETVPEGVVIREWAGGYRLGERLLRAAKVVVSAGPAVEEEPEDQYR